jgi:hypothetical protein
VNQAREHCLHLVETALQQNFKKHFIDCPIKFAVADEEAHSSAVNEEFAIFSSSKQAVGYKAAIMKYVNLVKQATASGLLHSAFLPKELKTETATCSEEPLLPTVKQENDTSAPASWTIDKSGKMSEFVGDCCKLSSSLDISSSLIKSDHPDASFSEAKAAVTSPILSCAESSHTYRDLTEVTDVKSQSDVLKVEPASPECPKSSRDVDDAKTSINDCTSDVSVISSSLHDSGLADSLTKPRKMVRISDLPPKVSYFRQSNSELAHKRKHTDDAKV